MAPPQPIPYPAYPADATDPFLFIMEMQSAHSRRAASVLNKRGIGYQDPEVLPAHPDSFPRGCGDLLYRPPTRTPRPECMFFPHPKPWNPNDPCLIAAAKAYWDAIDKVNKYYQEQQMLTARKRNDNLERIEGERVACRAGCDPQWPTACAAACNETAETKTSNWLKWYEEESERLTREQQAFWKGHEGGFWAAAQACGYSSGSLGGGAPDWNGPVPILREETQSLIGHKDQYTPIANPFKVAGCLRRCYGLKRGDPGHEGETEEEFSARQYNCQLNCLQYYETQKN